MPKGAFGDDGKCRAIQCHRSGHRDNCYSVGAAPEATASTFMPRGLRAMELLSVGPCPHCPLQPQPLPLLADKGILVSLEQKLREVDEECREEERRRVDLELSIVDVKDNLKKAEAGPVTLGTTVDTIHLESTSPRVSPCPCVHV